MDTSKRKGLNKPFLWQEPHGIADYQQTCEWNELVLWASGTTGEWRVVQLLGRNHYHTIVSDRDQARGIDMADTKRRAQAAAMSIHSR